jgi:hypothetical protein
MIWGRSVAVNMPACQAGDRGFESRRSRLLCESETSRIARGLRLLMKWLVSPFLKAWLSKTQKGSPSYYRMQAGTPLSCERISLVQRQIHPVTSPDNVDDQLRRLRIPTVSPPVKRATTSPPSTAKRSNV